MGMTNKFTKKCSQCGNYRQVKNMKFYPAEKQIYADGRVEVDPDMYFCKEHEEDWYLAYDGMSPEEMPERPEVTYL